ncbi:propanediol/glycerol family dehydratase large subunit [Candidatus Formimonas warabiya]|uniref:propanediol/glycerol family dehydratase large subunit n=1 Tax=Formimonas warabiya TaxID=1761012 RepID=UPI0011D14DF4|nr:propanediol/glycerol family dehydratase large subunit [Candidatus Formimonas warabiya]
MAYEGKAFKTKRFQALAEREVNKHTYLKEWPEKGITANKGINDPKPSIKIENGLVVEMDGMKRQDFDMIDQFIADYYIDKSVVEEAMAMDSLKIARMIVDICVPRQAVIRLAKGFTPAKFVEVANYLDECEIIMGIHKMRARRRPGIQCHTTNEKDNPVQMAADTAENRLRGFDESETTTGVAPIAPLNAIACLIGGQTPKVGLLTQCAVEEALELDLGMRGLTTYAETVSVYGTERVFADGDDTPWSKAFLAAGYASRGIKLRFTSGSGSEVQMGYAEGRSMLYLETKCIMITKACGVQGLQNGSISCNGIAMCVPGGMRSVHSENLITALCDLENASGCDQIFSPSDLRRAARTYPLMWAGTDFIFSGYGGVPNYDNMFAGANFDANDFDDYLVVQRDLIVNGGLVPVTEEETIAVRNRAARAVQAVFTEMGWPEITDGEVEAATYAHGSKNMPERNIREDINAAQDLMKKGVTGVDLIKALAKHGFEDIAENVLTMMKHKVAGDFLHTSAIVTGENQVLAAVNNLNDYEGPGTGYRLEEDPETWEKVQRIPQEVDPKTYES